MKKSILCLIALLLTAVLLCGCALFSGSEDTTADSTAVTTDTAAPTEVALENWGAPFAAEGTQEQIGYSFITTVFPDTWRAALSCASDTKITKWGIGEKSEDDSIQVYLSFAVFATEPTPADTAILNEGNTQTGKDEYEGAVILTRYCYLEKQPDGNWQCKGFGLSW